MSKVFRVTLAIVLLAAALAMYNRDRLFGGTPGETALSANAADAPRETEPSVEGKDGAKAPAPVDQPLQRRSATPEATKPAAAETEPKAGEATWQEPRDVEFIAAADKKPQRYVEMLPAGYKPGEPVDVMIVLHGHASDRWQYIRQDRGECKGARDVALKHGMVFIAPDYRATTSWMGPLAEADMLQIIALLGRQHKVRRVLLGGASMGGASSLIFATLHPDRVQGVVSQNGMANMLTYENFQPAIKASYGGSKEEKPEEYRARSAELHPERLTMPVAFTVGALDTAVPPDSVRRLAEALLAKGRKDVLLLDNPRGGHSTGYDQTVEAYEFVIKAMDAKEK